MATKKYTRKALKQPDEFISFSMRAWSFLRSQAPFVLVAVGVAVLLVAGVWGWTALRDRSGAKATEGLTRAVEMYRQTVIPMASKLPPSEDGIPRFGTRDAKLKAAEEEVSKVLSSGGALKSEALALRASIRYDAGKYREALEDYQKILAETNNDVVRARTVEDIGYCHEGLKEWDQALASFRKLPRDGEKKWVAMYHEARVMAKQGQVKEAAKLYTEIVEKAGPGTMQDRASDQLALLEGK